MPLTVSIFEDIPLHTAQLKSLISLWAQKNMHQVTILCYTDGRELNSTIIAQSDILFLDIEIPGLNGISLARKIRETNDHVPIVFTTNHSQYVFKGYTVQAFRYLLKPIPQDECFACMNRALQYHMQKNTRFLNFPHRNGIEHLPIHSILYIESDDHYINVVTTNGTHRYLKKLSELVDGVRGTPLIRCHRSYIINCSHIYTIEGNYAILDNHSSIPISRAAMPAVISYLSHNIGGGDI